MDIKDSFITEMEHNFSKEELSLFLDSLSNDTVKHIRLNPFKITEWRDGNRVDWCNDGYTLQKKKVFTTDPLFHAGAYYVQEASSMYLEEIFSKIILSNIQSPKVLDLCAAPGGKSTHIASLIGQDGVLVANEVIRSRASVLKENMVKWGIGNAIVTCNDPKSFSKLKEYFDVVVADVPCSGEGMFRKSEKARQEWSLDNVALCKARGARIISDVWSSLKSGGYFVYSTCTFNRYENEETIEWICDNFDVERVEATLSLYDNRIVHTATNGHNGYRFYPHKVDSEGYFVTILRKSGDNDSRERRNTKKQLFEKLSKEEQIAVENIANINNLVKYNGTIFYANDICQQSVKDLSDNLNIIHFGIELGEVLKGRLKPEHSLAMWSELPVDAFVRVELSYDDALEYLRRKSIYPSLFAEGYNIVTYNHLPLGFVKRIANRINNLYSKDSMILHL